LTEAQRVRVFVRRKPRTIDNSSLLISSGIAYSASPYASPARHSYQRQLPSLASEPGSSTSHHHNGLPEHVAPGSLTPLPHIELQRHEKPAEYSPGPVVRSGDDLRAGTFARSSGGGSHSRSRAR